jgi:RimJ/RimL family protein N-acetyltransferase
MCVDIGRQWGLKRIYSETTGDNHTMIRIYNKCGFEVRIAEEPSIVLATKAL